MDYVKIPQNVRVEDKLIGPFSLKQIILIAVGGGFSYSLFAMLSKTYGAVPVIAHALIWWPAILSVAFSLIRINDISLFRYVLLMIEMMSKPRKRVWQPRQGITINVQTRPTKKKEKNDKKNVEEEKKSAIRLEDLSVILDQEGKSDNSKSSTVNVDALNKNVDSLRHVSK
jgi:hypothetical protein